MKLGRLKPIDTYFYMHDPRAWISLLFTSRSGKPFRTDEICWARIEKAWRTIFMMDDSGRSTAKTFDYMLSSLAKLPLLQDREVIYFSQDARRGSDKTRSYAGKWIKNCPYFADRIVPIDSIRGPGVRNKGNTTEIPFKNGSLYKSYTPDWATGGENTQSDRCNELIFNEWTSYPSPEAMVLNVEPIATHTNFPKNSTKRFLIAMEKLIGTPLGSLTDQVQLEKHNQTSEDNFIPRPHLVGLTKAASKIETLESFFKYFKMVFGFSYQKGMRDSQLQFPKINGKEDIEVFFADWLDCDPVYANKIVYDGSAKRPSDDCFVYYEWHKERMDKGDPTYDSYNVSYQDIAPEWEGLIYDMNIIGKAKQQMLYEDFQRVYLGQWEEGTTHKPYNLTAINRCRTDIPVVFDRTSNDAIYVFGVDAAKGTEAMRRGHANVNMAGEGDDAGGVAIEVGAGTPESPHKVSFVWKARDVRGEPTAVGIHEIHDRMGFNLIGIDPNGGGSGVVDDLMKTSIDLDGKIYEFEPLIMHDYVGNIPGQRILMFMSNSESLIKEAFRKSEHISPFKGDDVLLDAYHTNAQNLIEKKSVIFPMRFTPLQLTAMMNNGAITRQEYDARLDFEEMIDQILGIRYVLDKRSTMKDKRVKTANGVFKYTSSKKKDLAMALIYGLFIAKVWNKWNTDTIPQGGNKHLLALG